MFSEGSVDVGPRYLGRISWWCEHVAKEFLYLMTDRKQRGLGREWVLL
jgi:hypothetical protein